MLLFSVPTRIVMLYRWIQILELLSMLQNTVSKITDQILKNIHTMKTILVLCTEKQSMGSNIKDNPNFKAC